MNILFFTNGGFVAHRINGLRLSAWYDARGNVLSMEKIGTRGHVVRTNSDDRARAASIGRAWRQTRCNNVYLARKARASFR